MKSKILQYLILLVLVLVPTLAMAYPKSFYTNTSVLADGRWVKIQVDHSGIFQIDYDTLRRWGFSNPSNVAVYGVGGIKGTDHNFSSDYIDDLVVAPVIHTADGRILFYGEGSTRASVSDYSSATPQWTTNLWDDKGSYFLTDSRQYATIQYDDYDSEGVTRFNLQDWHHCVEYIEREVQNPGEGGAIYHGPKLSPGETERFAYKVCDYYSPSGVSGEFAYEGAVSAAFSTRMSVSPSGNIDVTANSSSQSVMNNSPTRMYNSLHGSVRFVESVVAPLTDSEVYFDVTVPSNFAGSYAAIDFGRLSYPARNVFGDRSERYFNFGRAAAEGQNFRIFDAPEGIQIWNVTNPGAYYAYSTVYDADTRTVNASFGKTSLKKSTRVIVFDPAKQHSTVEYAGEVPNQNIHGMDTPDMLIVTTEENRPAAEELAAIHESIRGIEVAVITQEEAFNEFTFGSRHPAAIRRAAKMFADRDPGRLRYLLLYGPATYDNRAIVAPRPGTLISFETDDASRARESATNYCSDFYFGMIGDDYSHSSVSIQEAHISVGRIPVTSPSIGHIVNEKIRSYLLNSHTARHYLSAIMMSDRGDRSGHILQSEEAIANLRSKRSSLTTFRVDRSVYPSPDNDDQMSRQVIKRLLSHGMGYMSYSGHGDHVVLSTSLYNITDANNYVYDMPPLAILATCDAFPLDRTPNSLAYNMLTVPNGGAIGILAACRSVFMEHNKTLNNAVAAAYANAEDGDTGADIVRKARNSIVVGTTLTGLADNTMAFNYCGDPSLPLGAPTYGIAATYPAEAVSGSKLHLSADIVDGSGRKVPHFAGQAIIDIYDSPVLRTDIDPARLRDTAWVCDEVILATLPVEVVDGHLEADIVVPETSVSGAAGRVVVTAIDNVSHLTAANDSDVLTITNGDGTLADDIDTSAPVIEQFYIGSPDFESGSETGSTVNLTAVIDPSPTGLKSNVWGLSQGQSLTLDETSSFPEATNNIDYADGKAYIRFQSPTLSDGKHSFTLRVVNNVGQSASATIDFVVRGGSLTGTLVAEDVDPARAPFDIALESSSSDAVVSRLIIRDASGTTVRSVANPTMPYRWDLTTGDGTPAPDGKYTVTALLQTDSEYGHTSPLSVVVLK